MKHLLMPNKHSTGSSKSRQQVADGTVTSEAISGRDSSLACRSVSLPGQCPPRSPGSWPGESQGTRSGSYRLPMTAWSHLPAKCSLLQNAWVLGPPGLPPASRPASITALSPRDELQTTVRAAAAPAGPAHGCPSPSFYVPPPRLTRLGAHCVPAPCHV